MEKHKIDVLGIPWDFGSSFGRPGARYAPKAVRENMVYYTRRIKDGEIYDVDHRTIFDVSGLEFCLNDDLALAYGDMDESYRRMERAAKRAIEAGNFLVGLGGDHSITYPLVKAFNDYKKGKIGLIQFDAHLDLMDHSDLQGKFSHSSPIRRSSELPGLNPENIVQIGVRGYNYAESFRYVLENGIKQFTPADVTELGWQYVAEKAIATACSGTESVYLTFDIDAFDPAFAPGTGGDDPFGLTPAQVFPMLEMMAPHIGAMDIAEINPICDRNDISSLIATKMIFKIAIAKYGVAKT